MNVKLGICNFCVPGTGVFAPRIVKDFGLDGMSIEYGSWEHGNPLSQRYLQDLYLDAQQKFAIEYPNIGVSDGDNIAFKAAPGTKDDEIFNKMGIGAIDAAAYMGIGLVFFSNFGPSLAKTDEDFENASRRYQYFCDYAGEKGIKIGCENPNTVEEQKKIYEMVDRENFYLFYDSCNHHCLADYDVHKCLRELYPYYINQMHVKDGVPGKNASMVVGTGSTGFQETIDFLKEQNYEGWLILENLYELENMRVINPDYFEIMKADVAALKAAVK
ncbi:MAG: TIM barrel protein [Eubacterium sp.]|nr:TIM barrel protein [Eubacterium sp.]